ncbi:MAG: hypothetical protein WCF24_03405 [Acidimicrobiales bacterium]
MHATKTLTAQMATSLAIASALTNEYAEFDVFAHVSGAVTAMLSDEEGVTELARNSSNRDRMVVAVKKRGGSVS